MQFAGNITLDDNLTREELVDQFAVLAQRLETVRADKEDVETRLLRAKREHGRFIEEVADGFHAEADANNLCEAYDRAVERINERLEYEGFDTIPPREKMQEVEVSFSGRLEAVRHTIRIKARSLEAAQAILAEAVQTGDVNDLLRDDGEFPYDTVDAVLTAAASDEYFRNTSVEVV